MTGLIHLDFHGPTQRRLLLHARQDDVIMVGQVEPIATGVTRKCRERRIGHEGVDGDHHAHSTGDEPREVLPDISRCRLAITHLHRPYLRRTGPMKTE